MCGQVAFTLRELWVARIQPLGRVLAYQQPQAVASKTVAIQCHLNCLQYQYKAPLRRHGILWSQLFFTATTPTPRPRSVIYSSILTFMDFCPDNTRLFSSWRPPRSQNVRYAEAPSPDSVFERSFTTVTRAVENKGSRETGA